MNGEDDYSQLSLHQLFRSEAESQAQILTQGLLLLDRNGQDLKAIEPLMRAAHSLKGAARIVNMEPIERLSHVMEDCFVAAQKGKLQLTGARIDRLLSGVDLITQLASLSEADVPAWLEQNKLHVANLLVSMYDAADPAKLNDPSPIAPPLPSTTAVTAAAAATAPAPSVPDAIAAATPTIVPTAIPVAPITPSAIPRDEQVLKVSVRSFDRLLSLASESRVATHSLGPYVQAMQRYKKKKHEMVTAFEQLSDALSSMPIDDTVRERLLQVRQRINPVRQELVSRIAELEAYERRLLAASQEILDEVLTLRMRPFRDGVQGFPRMVRDLAKSLGKDAHLEIVGEDTLVDRDILARIESPINHMLRNAIDHGMEVPEQRLANGKPARGNLRLEARHSAGMLTILISDDGQGVDLDSIRKKLVERKMASEAMAAEMSSAELLDFLLLPAFSLKDTATHVSGRGVGLDAVSATVRQLNGTVRLETERGKGFFITITLPLSQSVVRALVVDIAGEPYAIPITKIDRVMEISPSDIFSLENKQFFAIGKDHIGMVSAAQLLDLGDTQTTDRNLPVIIVGSGQRRHALAVDAIIGEQSLAVQPIDAIFGKLRDISAAALLDDGSPVLILDIDDVLISIDKLASEGSLRQVQRVTPELDAMAKRVLVIDDSLTVREMERKLLSTRGYKVDVAVDGMDGWNAVRSVNYDLVITDVDMPRMDGIELVTLIKQDARLRTIPVMIVSYKDRPEDRARGITAGADYYLTKGSFHDETLLDAVVDLIGESDK
ncbi:hybrid sensor histidine kinase/response regulator [Noviherbaspirillum sp. Root189]|uniref:hybrid sensor histidine kinase/response regulator n=1 Tax=Noviherbaspirillum sp. Root189 TaxID=1736487 RepID=UPI00070D9C32|nr:hybrid sensor histidine kinase/response regulator [Noviherbaspirillum sp. Root189]KRB92899.1 oxidoreductase [Noviherbaspirillum sp. Root189]